MFLHRASRTLLLTDISFNLRNVDSATARFLLGLLGAYGHFGPSRLGRSLMRDRAAVRKSIDRILRWDFDRVTVTHGEIVETGGHAALRAAFSWLDA